MSGGFNSFSKVFLKNLLKFKGKELSNVVDNQMCFYIQQHKECNLHFFKFLDQNR